MAEPLICEGTYTAHWETAEGGTCRRCGAALRKAAPVREFIEAGATIKGRPFTGSQLWDDYGAEVTGRFVTWDAEGDAVIDVPDAKARFGAARGYVHGHSVEVVA